MSGKAKPNHVVKVRVDEGQTSQPDNAGWPGRQGSYLGEGMNVIGFSSGIVGRLGNVDRMVLAVLEKSGYNHEFVKAYRNQAESILGSLAPNDPIDGMTRRVPHSANPGGDRASEAAGLDQGRRQQ